MKCKHEWRIWKVRETPIGPCITFICRKCDCVMVKAFKNGTSYIDWMNIENGRELNKTSLIKSLFKRYLNKSSN